MAKTNVSKNNQINQYVKNEIYGIIIFGLSLIIALSIYVKPTGIAGIVIRDFIMGMFGLGAYIFPIFFIFVGGFFIIKKGKVKLNTKFYYTCLFIYIINIMLTLKYSNKYYNQPFIEKLKLAYNNGISNRGGGIISELICTPMIFIFGIVGSYIIFLVFY